MDGALDAIRYAREHDLALLGTCSGFQHVLVEFARNVAGIAGADHPGLNPDASDFVLAPLACPIVGQDRPVLIEAGTLAGQLYQASETVEPFYCSFGLNPVYRDQFEKSGMVFSGSDRDGVPRVLEVPGHPFFLATLYVPQAAPARENPHPVLAGFAHASSL
jgi:CTP synthase (UTP-ammonia lyase)